MKKPEVDQRREPSEAATNLSLTRAIWYLRKRVEALEEERS